MCVKLEGKYFVEGDKLKKDSLILLQRERKKDIQKKPVKFLLVDLGKGFEYVSSLYQIGQNSYVFDTSNQMKKYSLEKSRYKLVIKKESAIINKLE